MVLNGISLKRESWRNPGRARPQRNRKERIAAAHHWPRNARLGVGLHLWTEHCRAGELDRMGEIRKKMGFLFQHAALYDSLTVAENVAFPLEHHRREMSNSERSDRVKQLLAEVGMEGNLERCLPISQGECKSASAWRARFALKPRFCFSTSLRPASTPSVRERSTI
jgi:energy-coupling factor transporter ATP-binding protein EcfA2